MFRSCNSSYSRMCKITLSHVFLSRVPIISIMVRIKIDVSSCLSISVRISVCESFNLDPSKSRKINEYMTANINEYECERDSE